VRSRFRLARLAFLVVLVTAPAVMSTSRRNGQAHYLRTQRYEDGYYLPPPAWLQIFSIGHREALAGMIWLKGLVYFGDELGHRGEVANLFHYADAMLALDANFKRVYAWVATCAIYRTGTVEVKDVRRAIAYLEQGVRRFPDDGELAWSLGATYLYELIPMLETDEERQEARRLGVEHIMAASRLGAGPAWLALSTVSELGKLGQTDRQLAHLQEVYAQVSDPDVKKSIEERIAELRDASYLEALRRTHEQVESARRRDFPYVDFDLFLLVGSRPPFDGRALMLRKFDPTADVMSEGEP
jgi:hypothetical protein